MIVRSNFMLKVCMLFSGVLRDISKGTGKTRTDPMLIVMSNLRGVGKVGHKFKKDMKALDREATSLDWNAKHIHGYGDSLDEFGTRSTIPNIRGEFGNFKMSDSDPDVPNNCYTEETERTSNQKILPLGDGYEPRCRVAEEQTDGNVENGAFQNEPDSDSPDLISEEYHRHDAHGQNIRDNDRDSVMDHDRDDSDEEDDRKCDRSGHKRCDRDGHSNLEAQAEAHLMKTVLGMKTMGIPVTKREMYTWNGRANGRR